MDTPTAGQEHLHPPGARRLAHLLLAAVVVGVLLTVTAGPASAHAAFVSSQPKPGADLASAPGVVRLRFTEPLIAELSTVTVTDPLGQTFKGGPTSDTQMQVDLDSTARGSYTVEWKTVSPLDGHTLTGSYQFGVGSDVGAQADPSDGPSGGDLAVAVARAIEYAGLLGALGLLSLSALADGAGLQWRPRGLHRWVAVAAVGGTATVAGEVLLASSGSLLSAAQGFVATGTGRVRLVRLAIEAGAAVLAATAARVSDTARVESRTVRVATTLAVMGALVAVAAAGHAAAASYGVWLAAGHLWAAGVWAGTILAMALHRPSEGWRAGPGRLLVREFTPIALATFTATVVLGLGRAVQELAHPSDIWATAYGQVLGAKTALVVVMVALSAQAWRRVRHHPCGEGVLAAGVVLLAAVLVAFPVPPGRAGDDPTAAAATDTGGLPQTGDLTFAHAVDDTIVALSIRPAEPGINDLFVHLVPPGGDQADQVEVTLTVDGGDPADTRRCGPTCRVATAPIEEGTTLAFDLTGPAGSNGTATFTVPTLPTPDARDLVTEMRERMDELDTVRYDETLGPGDPPTRSTWELVFPDRIHGVLHPPTFKEIIRIEDRWWTRDDPDAQWTEARGSGQGLSVRVDQSLWDVNSTNHHQVGTETIDGSPTRVVTFFTEVGQLPIWYRLWIDHDHRVRRAVMLTQGHVMEQHYYDFDAPLTVDPPT